MHPALNHLNPTNQPDLFWEFNDIDLIIPETIHDISKQIDKQHLQKLLDPIRRRIKTESKTRIAHVLLAEDDSSKDAVILHFNPFANGMKDNMLLRLVYLQRAFTSYDLNDSQGAPLPLLGFAAPNASGFPSAKLTVQQRKALRAGDFKPLAQHYVAIVKKYGYSNLLITGYSQGATVAMAMAAEALNQGITVSHVAVGEPANVMKRSLRQLGKDFGHSAPSLNNVLETSGIEHLKQFYVAGSTPSFMLRLAKQARLNFNLLSGLAKNGFETDLAIVLSYGTHVTVGWSGLNRISPQAEMRRIVAASRETGNSMHTVEVANAHHSWGDRLNLLATFYSYGLVR